MTPFGDDSPVYVISVAAELSGLHPQTLRTYDRMGLVSPGRTSGRGRRYSMRDIVLLREIQRLSQDEGINLAGIRQILDLQGFLAEHWRTKVSEKTGSMIPEIPTTLILYREDCGFLLDSVLPRQDVPHAGYDLILASQPFRLRASVDFKAGRVLAPLARALRPGGRLLGIHSAGNDPGLEIVQRVWPAEDPFTTSRHALLEATRTALGAEAAQFRFDPLPTSRALFRYEMHTLPDEIDSADASIGTSTLLAAWNAATYVSQIEDERLTEAMSSSKYLEATRAVLKKNGALWFNDESYVIARNP